MNPFHTQSPSTVSRVWRRYHETGLLLHPLLTTRTMQLDWHVPTSSSSPRMTHTQALQSLSSLPKQSQECGDGVLHDGTWTGPHKDQHMLLCARKNRSTTKLCPEGYWWICPTKWLEIDSIRVSSGSAIL